MPHEGPSKNVAVVTGASSGIGKEIARLHASLLLRQIHAMQKRCWRGTT